MSDDRLATIRLLLAKAEATPYPAEAEAFNAKAAELMARYAIDHAMLADGAADPGTPGELVIDVHRPYTAQQALLICEVAKHFTCLAVRYVGQPGSSNEQVRVVGYQSDLDLVETLVTSLLVQLRGALLRDAPPSRSAAETASWRRAFMAGFIEGVVARLASQRAAAVSEARREQAPGAPSVSVVLADRSASVQAEFRRRHPRVRTSRVGVGSSQTGRRSGRAAGDRADLGGTRIGARAALGR